MFVKSALLVFVLASAYGAAETARITSEYVVTNLAASEADVTYAVAAK